MLYRLSAPHISLFRNVSMKTWLFRFTIGMVKGALPMVSPRVVLIIVERPSRLTRKLLLRLSTCMRIVSWSLKTNGRTFRLWGATGVIAKLGA